MAKRGKRKGFRVIKVKKQFALSTLADGTLLSSAMGSAFSVKMYIISADLYIALRGGTAGEGPILVGLADSDLSDTEITECLDAVYGGDEDIVSREQARRPVREIGMFPGLSTEELLNQGNKTRYKLKFPVGESSAIDLWARNESGAALTGGQIIEVYGTVYARRTG